jgi:large subunit ribosomal protein L9
MAVKVLLLENVDKLGKIGDEANVSEGYARNFLIPKGLGILLETRHKGRKASQANTCILRQLELKKARAQVEYEREVADAQLRADEISAQSLTIAVQAQDDGKLFGSVGAQQIVSALKELGLEVDRRKVALPEPIREVGMSNVDIHLHPEVTATVKVWVVKLDV